VELAFWESEELSSRKTTAQSTTAQKKTQHNSMDSHDRSLFRSSDVQFFFLQNITIIIYFKFTITELANISSGDGRPPSSFSIVFHQSRNNPPLSFSPLAMYDYGITFLKIFPKADYKKISSSFC